MVFKEGYVVNIKFDTWEIYSQLC